LIPFLRALDGAKSVLIAGCGGGFDVFAGVPLASYLMRRGASVAFANLSFANLTVCGGERLGQHCWLIDDRSNDLPYFPELRLAQWLAGRSLEAPVYAFARTGVEPLRRAYQGLLAKHDFDLVVLVDGGTDSVIFGDEPGLGTPAEDAISVCAATAAHAGRTILACLGFGIDHHHGVSHYAYLENVAALIQDGGYLGSISVTKEMPEGADYLDLIDFANERQPALRSIVGNSIASAMRGDFGDCHAISRTKGSELFINALMSQYWAFEASAVVARMAYSAALADTTTFGQVERVIENFRAGMSVRTMRGIPL